MPMRFSPATLRLPLGSTCMTVTVILPVNVFDALASPEPWKSFEPERSVFCLVSHLPSASGTAVGLKPTEPLRLALAADDLVADRSSLSTTVRMSPTWRGLRSSNNGLL